MKKFVPVFIWLLFALPCQARIITVDDDGPADFNTIQAAINDSNDGDIVEVQPGTYTGAGNYDIEYNGKAITIRSTDPNAPNIVSSTVIDGSSINDGQSHNGFYFHSNENSKSTLLGLSITGFYGNGIRISLARPFIGHCKIYGNVLGIRAAYAPAEDIETLISDCAISYNEYDGIRLYWADVKIENCIIENNVIFGIQQGQRANGDLFLENCRIAYNKKMGLNLWTDSGSAILKNCSIIGNGRGTYSSCNLTIENSVIAGNYGSAILFASPLTLRNCTIIGNYTETDYVISCTNWVGADIKNTIIYGNYPVSKIRFRGDSDNFVSYCNIEGDINSIQLDDGATLHWQDNIDCDPCFAVPGHWDANGTPEDANDDFWIMGDYHLKSQAGRWEPNSQTWLQDDSTNPCIDAGDPLSPIGLEPFPNGGIVNMGYYGGTAEASKSYFGEPICETILAGDINGDCRIDFKDFRFMTLHWLEDNTPPTPLPSQASSPNPSNGAMGVDPNTDLSWTAGSNATSHDVYFGTSYPPPFVCNQTSTTFDPGTMVDNTWYYWRIDEVNSRATTTGTTWFFGTGIPPPP